MIAERQEHGMAEHPVSNCSVAATLSKCFLVARLLTGDCTQAEKAVVEAINIWNPNEEDEDQLFQITSRTAARMQVIISPAGSNDECTADLWLPIELRRVLELSPEIRRCFVLRVLVGLPSSVCAQLLHLGAPQVDQCSCQAMKSLSALDRGSLGGQLSQLAKTDVA